MLTIILASVQNSESRYFIERLYAKYETRMAGIAYSILHDSYLAEDAVSDVFLRIIETLETFMEKNDNEIEGLIVIMTRNKSIDIYRKQQAKNTEDIDTFENISDDSFEDIADIIINSDTHDCLYKAIENLPEEMSSVIKLRVVFDLSFGQIAKMINISEGTARMRYFKAKKILTKIMKGVFEESE
ncbi:hypothetical protein FACS1894105_03810 [Clostridia bacterium]|nr:hypothetical protein FACS1894105_03810 [Clostridia bacterium]